jgi:hypothetical protein
MYLLLYWLAWSNGANDVEEIKRFYFQHFCEVIRICLPLFLAATLYSGTLKVYWGSSKVGSGASKV